MVGPAGSTRFATMLQFFLGSLSFLFHPIKRTFSDLQTHLFQPITSKYQTLILSTTYKI